MRRAFLKFEFQGSKCPFSGPCPEKGLQTYCLVSVPMLIHASECILSEHSILDPPEIIFWGYLPLSKINFQGSKGTFSKKEKNPLDSPQNIDKGARRWRIIILLQNNYSKGHQRASVGGRMPEKLRFLGFQWFKMFIFWGDQIWATNIWYGTNNYVDQPR